MSILQRLSVFDPLMVLPFLMVAYGR